jgi:hypothetical protein
MTREQKSSATQAHDHHDYRPLPFGTFLPGKSKHTTMYELVEFGCIFLG